MIALSPIASGSAGNATYIGTEDTKILIDCGISGVKLEKALMDINLSADMLDAIFVTHEHIDHVDGIGVLSRRYDIPIYATEGTWSNMPQKIGKISDKNIKQVYKNEKLILNDLCIKPFEVPHDAKEPVCYNVFYDGIKLSVATDLGHITRDVIENVRHCSALVLESNHDVSMVKNGAYPQYLKQRILGKDGHICNETCGKLLSCIMNDKLKNVFLGHISKENNSPDLAYLTVSDTLSEFGIDVKKHLNLHIAKEYGISEVIKLKA